MIELSHEEFSMIIAELMIGVAKAPNTHKQTESFIEFLWKSYKENKHIITIGVK